MNKIIIPNRPVVSEAFVAEHCNISQARKTADIVSRFIFKKKVHVYENGKRKKVFIKSYFGITKKFLLLIGKRLRVKELHNNNIGENEYRFVTENCIESNAKFDLYELE